MKPKNSSKKEEDYSYVGGKVFKFSPKADEEVISLKVEPDLTGVAALIWSYNINLTNTQVRQILEDTCDGIDIQNPNYLLKFRRR